MIGRRRFLVALLTAAAVLGASAAVLRPRLEGAIRARLAREAIRHDLRAQVEGVRLGVWPPLRLTGLRLEKPGVAAAVIDVVDVSLRLWGRGVLGRAHLAVGTVTVTGPGGLAVELAPTGWNVVAAPPEGFRAELREPAEGLTATWLPGPEGGRLEVRATDLSLGQLLVFRRDGTPLLDVGAVGGWLRLTTSPDGTDAEAEGTARAVRVASLSNDAVPEPTFGPPTDLGLGFAGSWRPAARTVELSRWRATAAGATLAGSRSRRRRHRHARRSLPGRREGRPRPSAEDLGGPPDPGRERPAGR